MVEVLFKQTWRYGYQCGEYHDVPESVADALVAQGIAVLPYNPPPWKRPKEEAAQEPETVAAAEGEAAESGEGDSEAEEEDDVSDEQRGDQDRPDPQDERTEEIETATTGPEERTVARGRSTGRQTPKGGQRKNGGRGRKK